MFDALHWPTDEARWLTVLGFGVALALAAWVAFRVLDAIVGRAISHSQPLSLLRRNTRKPFGVLLPLMALEVVVYGAPDALEGVQLTRQLMTVAVVFCMTWLLIQAVRAAGDIMIVLRPTSQSDNLAARRLQTQARVLTRSIISIIALIGVAMALMTFPNVRHIGTSILASAGLAGIVAGLAARPLLGNLIAGLQIGITQPIRIDDVVIVEGEFGTVEEITGTYVVVKIWDQRRMIVPLEWWTQNPFQNWTRSSAEILGTVTLWVDYRMPIEPLRSELQRICKGSPAWDGRVANLDVTDADQRAVQIRCLVSSANSGDSWNLRCQVREQLLAYVQAQFPDGLPQVRAHLHDDGPRPALGKPVRAA
ncbi:MAG: mechanosensitive ion channel [Aquabacterium sp.]